MRVLVTGGAGFIGSALVDFLLSPEAAAAGLGAERVVTLDKLTYAGQVENLARWEGDARHQLVCGDIADGLLVARLLVENEIQAVMHLAAESFVDRAIASPAPFIATNVVGTFQLLEAARAHAASRPDFRFLHVSTDEVFGTLPTDAAPFTEASPYAPNNAYAATKAGADFLVRAYHKTYGLNTIITNCSNNYGPRQHPEKLIPLLLRRIRQGDVLPLYGDGLQSRDWLHVEDHARGLALALRHGKAGAVYAFGGREERTNLEVAQGLLQLAQEYGIAGKGAHLAHVEDRPGHDRRYAMNPAKAETELSWQRQWNFDTGLRHTVEWYALHEAWVARVEARTASLRGNL